MKENYWKGKKVAVTGAKGFLGSHFVIELNKMGANVYPIVKEKTNLLDFNQTKEALKDVEIIINCAALDGNTEFKTKHAAEILDTNIIISSNILNSAIENGTKDIVLISSAEIYSPDAPSPIKEEDDYRIYNNHINNGYILSKRFMEILSDLYHEQFGIRVYLPRPSNIFGPGDHFDNQSTRAIPSFINKIISGNPIEIWGDGSQIRQFIYVKDVVRAVLEMVEKGAIGRLNISTNEYISILELAKKITTILKFEPDISLNKTKISGVKNRILDISKMLQLIDYNLTDLDSGLEKTVNWYKERLVK